MVRSLLSDDRLESVAPGFLASRGTPGVTEMTLSPFDDRILYTVVDVVDTSGNFTTWSRIGTASAVPGRLATQSGATGDGAMGARFDTANGTTNLTRYAAGIRTPGRHLLWAQTVGGMTGGQVGGDSPVVAASGGLTPGDGMLDATLAVFSTAVGIGCLLAAAFRGPHDEATRRLVMGWLARRYSAPPP